jgi:hypothetical protein
MDGPERSDPGGPPEDPESWTDEEWLSWLEATDDPDEADLSGTGGRRPWNRRRSASMLGAAMLGLHELIYGRKDDEIVIVADAGGDPPGDDQPQVHLDRDHPERSEVVVRHHRPEVSSESEPVAAESKTPSQAEPRTNPPDSPPHN